MRRRSHAFACGAARICSPACSPDPERDPEMAAKRRLLTDRYLRSLPPARRGHRDEVFDAAFPASASGSATPRMSTRRGAARPDASPSSCTLGSHRVGTGTAHHRRLWRGSMGAGRSPAHRRGMAFAGRAGYRPGRGRGRAPAKEARERALRIAHQVGAEEATKGVV